MSKFVLKPEDPNIITGLQNQDTVFNYLKNKDSLNFQVGDFLIKQNLRNNKWVTETISGGSKINKRYVCTHIDEFDIKYIRGLSSTGKGLPYVILLTHINNFSRYVLDPDFAEHLIFNNEDAYDHTIEKKLEKSRRDKITRLNKKKVYKQANLDELDKKLLTLKNGDFLWFGYCIPDAAVSKYEVISIKLEDNGLWHPQSGAFRKKTVALLIRSNGHDGYIHPWTTTTEGLIHKVIFFEEPFGYEII